MDNELSDEFLEYAKFDKAHLDLSNYSSTLKKALKANIAQQVYGPNAYEFIMNQDDPMILKVLQLDQPRVKE